MHNEEIYMTSDDIYDKTKKTLKHIDNILISYSRDRERDLLDGDEINDGELQSSIDRLHDDIVIVLARIYYKEKIINEAYRKTIKREMEKSNEEESEEESEEEQSDDK